MRGKRLRCVCTDTGPPSPLLPVWPSSLLSDLLRELVGGEGQGSRAWHKPLESSVRGDLRARLVYLLRSLLSGRIGGEEALGRARVIRRSFQWASAAKKSLVRMY